MTNTQKLFVIGGSAGALQVIIETLPKLKTTISFPILIVLHRKTDPGSVLEEVLRAKTKLKVKEADDKESLQPGIIYLAPADYHTLIENDHSVSLDYSEKVHFTRPSIDVTLQSASDVYGEDLYAAILSGANNDGAEGALQAEQKKAKLWVQDPETAEIPVMPLAVMQLTRAQVFRPEELAEIINSL
jgi:two-component system, chemotaxis family, protein-glutamate methylesterase/glutaminase